MRTGRDDEGDDIESHAEARLWVEAVVEDDQRQFGQCWRPEVSHAEKQEFLCLVLVIDWGVRDILCLQKEVSPCLAKHGKGACLGKRRGKNVGEWLFLLRLTFM